MDLNWWIAFTRSSAQLEEIQHPDDRPTALFRRADGSKFEVRYQFGKIIPQDLDWTDPAPMHELAAHMNEERKKPIQASETTRGQ